MSGLKGFLRGAADSASESLGQLITEDLQQRREERLRAAAMEGRKYGEDRADSRQKAGFLRQANAAEAANAQRMKELQFGVDNRVKTPKSLDKPFPIGKNEATGETRYGVWQNGKIVSVDQMMAGQQGGEAGPDALLEILGKGGNSESATFPLKDSQGQSDYSFNNGIFTPSGVSSTETKADPTLSGGPRPRPDERRQIAKETRADRKIKREQATAEELASARPKFNQIASMDGMTMNKMNSAQRSAAMDVIAIIMNNGTEEEKNAAVKLDALIRQSANPLTRF